MNQLLEPTGATFGAVDGAVLWQGHGIAVVFDGVLFEQQTLSHQLNLPPGASSAEVAAHAYLTWGDLFPDHLDGEFALALWQPAERKLLLSRDAMSRRPLFYAATAEGICFASEPRGLMGWRGLPNEVDEEIVARVLALQQLPGRTLYRGVRTFPGNQVLIFGADLQPQSKQYWFPDRQPELRFRDSRQYSDALRESLTRAVERRLPAHGLVAAQLSSGFDSSGVTALAAVALARQNRGLVAYTSVPRQRTAAHEIMPDRFDDEWPLAAQVAAMYPNVEHIAISSDARPWWESIDFMSRFAGGPIGFIRNVRWFYAILENAHSRGAVTMLEGQAGNLTSSYGGGFSLYHLRTQGRWSELVRNAVQQHGTGLRWSTLVHDAWMPSAAAKARVDRLRGRQPAPMFQNSAMRPDFYRSVVSDQRTLSAMGSVIEGDRTNGRTWRYSILQGTDMGMMWAAQRRGLGLNREDPTADRRVVELCLSIPDQEFAPKGKRRGLYREAFRDILPDQLLSERRRGLQSSDFLEHFEPWIPELHIELDLQESSPLVRKIIDLPRLRKMLHDFPTIKAGPRHTADQLFNYTFGGAICMGRFLRQLDASEAH